MQDYTQFENHNNSLCVMNFCVGIKNINSDHLDVRKLTRFLLKPEKSF